MQHCFFPFLSMLEILLSKMAEVTGLNHPPPWMGTSMEGRKAKLMCEIKKKLSIRIVPDETVTEEEVGIIRKIFHQNIKKYKEAGFEVE